MGREAQARARPAGLRTPHASSLHPLPLAVQAAKGGTMRVRMSSCRSVSSLGCSRPSRQRSEGRKVWGERGLGPGWMGREHSCRRAHVPWGCACFHTPSLPRLSLHSRPVVHAIKDGTMRVREFPHRWVWSLRCRRPRPSGVWTRSAGLETTRFSAFLSRSRARGNREVS
jgi:hypothetical protein